MSGARYTPGRWLHGRAGSGGLDDQYVWAEQETGFELAHVRDGGVPGQAEANARLIAAAPDLLRACALFVEASERPGANGKPGTAERPNRPTETDWRAALVAARAAIAKAKGGAA